MNFILFYYLFGEVWGVHTLTTGTPTFNIWLDCHHEAYMLYPKLIINQIILILIFHLELLFHSLPTFNLLKLANLLFGKSNKKGMEKK